MAIDPDLKAKWVAALRSGDYKQGQHYLKTPDDTYCCLGVLCEIAGWPTDDPEGDTTLPPYIPHIELLGEDTVMRLAGINDRSTSFAPVIEYIERNL